MEKFILDKVNESYYSIGCDNQGMLMELSRYMSFRVPNFFFSPKYKMGGWDGMLHLFKRDGLLPSGLFHRFKSFLASNNYECHYLHNREKSEYTLESVDKFCNSLLKDWKHTIREDQIEAIFKALKYSSGLIMNPTSSGKSIILVCIAMLRMLSTQEKTLIIVPNVSLVEQLFENFNEYGIDASEYIDKIYSGQKQSNKPITIATYQSLNKRGPGYFEQFHTLLIDEVHVSTGKDVSSVNKIAAKCINASMRIGMTGTIPVEPSEFFSACSFLGPVIFQQSSKELIEKDILSDILIVNMSLKYSEEVCDTLFNRSYDDEIKFIEGYSKRNKILDIIFDKAIPSDHNTILLVKHIDHLEKTFEYLKKKYPDRSIFKWYQETPPKEREAIRQKMESLEGAIIVGTFATLAVGISINRIHAVIFYTPYKSFFKVVQAIGRGLRKHSTKEKLVLFDCHDDLRVKGDKSYENHSTKHSHIRLQVYEKQGFKVISKNIIID